MTRYDPDLIAALAGGQLPPNEAAALEKEIARDPRAAAELAAQRLAIETLRQAPLPLLSAEERTELRRQVAAALNLEEPAVVPLVSPRRRVPWRPLAVAAAALAVIAGVVPLVGLLSVGGDQQAITTMAEADLVPRNGEESATPGVTSLTGTAEQADDGPVTTGDLLFAEGWTDEATRALEDLLADPAALIAAADKHLSTCAAEAADLFGETEALTAAPVPLAQAEAVAWFILEDETSLATVALFDPAGCTLLAGPLAGSHP